MVKMFGGNQVRSEKSSVKKKLKAYMEAFTGRVNCLIVVKNFERLTKVQADNKAVLQYSNFVNSQNMLK